MRCTPLSILILLLSALTPGFSQSDIVALKVIMKGKGTVIPDSPPPYRVGQTITLSFSPSGGAQFSTKPDVPVAAETDSLFGWVFDHWSYSEHSEQSGSGLDNPLTITLQKDMDLHVTFLPMGTAAHPNPTQYQQLKAISEGRYEGWTTLSPSQQKGIGEKARHYRDEYLHYNEKWGQPATVWWEDFQRKVPFGYDYLGEGTTWAGLHLQALALQYSVMPDDVENQQAILRVLEALDRNSLIMGVPGRVARFSGPTDDKAYHWYYKDVKVGAFQGHAPWEDMTWLGKPTRDTHTGLFTGLATVAALCRDHAKIYDLARTLTERVVDRLIEDQWKIKGIQKGYQALNEKSLKQLQMRVAYQFNPEKYSHFKKDIDNFTLKLKEGKGLYENLYWVEWMTWARAFGTIILESSPEKRQQYILQVNGFFEKKVNHLNPYYTGITCYLNSLNNNSSMEEGLYDKSRALLEGLLLAFPDGIKWHREVNLFEDGRFEAKDEKHVVTAVLPNQRVNADFNAQRSAARAKGGGNRQSYQFTNFDMYLLYWLGRAGGRLP